MLAVTTALGSPETHLACGGCFKYFRKGLRESKVMVFHGHPKSGLQALDCNCVNGTYAFSSGRSPDFGTLGLRGSPSPTKPRSRPGT